MLYKVNRAISVRLSTEAGTLDYDRFREWLPGEELDTDNAPDYLDIGGLIAIGAIEPVVALATTRVKVSSVAQDAQDSPQEAGALSVATKPAEGDENGKN